MLPRLNVIDSVQEQEPIRNFSPLCRIIHAAGELEASEKLSRAAAVISAEPVAITLRYLQTLTEIASEKNSTIIFPLPIELLHLLRQAVGIESKTSSAA
jgi:regulator of protease activity HflC (stomatin/prohibitin superfamily)